MGRTRRTFTAEEKLKVVMAVIQDGKAVSDVAKENRVNVKCCGLRFESA